MKLRQLNKMLTLHGARSSVSCVKLRHGSLSLPSVHLSAPPTHTPASTAYQSYFKLSTTASYLIVIPGHYELESCLYTLWDYLLEFVIRVQSVFMGLCLFCCPFLLVCFSSYLKQPHRVNLSCVCIWVQSFPNHDSMIWPNKDPADGLFWEENFWML